MAGGTGARAGLACSRALACLLSPTALFAGVLRATRETRAGTGVGRSHELLSCRWDGGKVGAHERSRVPLWALRGAHGSRATGLGTGGVFGSRGLGKLAHEVLEVGKLIDAVAIDFDKAVVRRLL